MREHDYEPVRGLPEALPEGEHIIWQGAPHWRTLAHRVLHTRAVAIYFGVLIVWRLIDALDSGASLAAAAVHASVLLPFAGLAVGILAVLAWAMARSTVYTITNRRVVLRYGVALEKAINVPFTIVGSAGLRLYPNGTGSLPLELTGEGSIAYLHLWPHARPWHFNEPQPMLRCVPEAASVARILTDAVIAARGREEVVEAAPAPQEAAAVDGTRQGSWEPATAAQAR